jgi:hypothetical protein
MSKQQARRGKLIICLLAAAMLMLSLVALGLRIWNRNKSSLINLPDQKEVVSIRAIAHGESYGMKSTPEFEVPPEYFPVILGILNPAKTKADIHESNFDPPLGDLQIAVRSGRLIKV